MPIDSEARSRYSTIQGNVHEEAEIAAYEGGRKAGPVHDWELLCKIEADPELQTKALAEAKEGDLDKVFVLACMYLHGKGVEKNQAAALELFKYAANKGHSNSQNNVGFMLEEGIGTRKDLKQAMSWYQKAADYKNGAGTCNLANMIEHGRGVPANPEQAYALYQKAAELGNKIAGQNVFAYDFEKERLSKIKGAPAGKPGTKTAVLPKTAFTYVPSSIAPPAVADVNKPVVPEKVAGADASGLQAGTPTLTAILNRLSKGTSLEHLAAKPDSSKPAIEPKKEEVAPVAKADLVGENKAASVKPSLQTMVETAKKVEEKQPEKALSTPIVALKPPVIAAKQPVVDELAKTIDKLPKPKLEAAFKKVEKTGPATAPAAAKVADPKITPAEKPAQKPVLVQAPVDKPAAIEKPAVTDKPVAVAEETRSEIKAVKSALDTPITYGTPKVEAIKPEVKPEEVAQSKPVETKMASKTDSGADTKVEQDKSASAKVEPKADTKLAAKPQAVPAQVAPQPKKSDASPASAIIKAATTPDRDKSSAEKLANDKTGVNRPIRDKWAMVVGITDFDDPDIPDLQYSAKDATDFYNYLVNEANFQPDHVRLILNEQATQRRVLSELGSKFLARVVKPDDLVVLYFSTHGSPSQLDPRGKNYLVACDSDSDDLFATGIEMQKLLDSIQGRVLTDRVLLVMDACHSGFAGSDSGSKGIARLGNFKADELAQGSGQLVICSSMPEERAWESTRYQNGVFTHRLLQGLRASGSSTTLIEAFRKTQTEVGIEVREDRPGAKQTPVLKGKWNGNDLILASVPYAPQAVPFAVSKNLSTDSRVDLIAAAPAQGVRNIAEGKKEIDAPTKPSSESAPRSGDIYLDEQFFSVKGDPKSLAKEYADAIRANGTDAELHFLRAKALIQLEDWHNAMASLNEAIQLSPNRANYYLGRAYVYFRQGKTVFANQDLAQARFHDKSLGDKVRFHK